MQVDEQEDGDEKESACVTFFETVKSKVDSGAVNGEFIASLEELPFVTPRGRYNLDFFDGFVRMFGKTNTYKIPY